MAGSKANRLRRRAGDLASVGGVLVVYGLLLVVVHRADLAGLLVRSTNGYQTLMQVVPTTVVGVYALALGSIFVMAQLVAPTRGSRSLMMLILERRFRTMVVATLLVAVGSVLLAGNVPDGSTPATVEDWLASAAAALAMLTVLVLVGFTVVLVQLFHQYNSPRQFSKRLLQLAGGRRKQMEPAIKALRQWLCTAAREGQTRDLYHACMTARELAGRYSAEPRNNGAFRGAPPIGDAEREAGQRTAAGQHLPALRLLLGESLGRAADPRPARSARSEAPWQQLEKVPYAEGWFAEQLSRALVRALEEGARADIAWRGLDELLTTQEDLLCWALEQRRCPEARHFLRGILEVCELGRQAESERTKRWFERPRSDLSVIDEAMRTVAAERGTAPELREHCHDARSQIRATLAAPSGERAAGRRRLLVNIDIGRPAAQK